MILTSVLILLIVLSTLVDALGAQPATAPSPVTAPASAPATLPGASMLDGRPAVRITRAANPPKIDGRLDDACWVDAGIIDQFTQVDPVEGAAPSERTLVRVTYDQDNLYIAIRCFDSDPKLILAKQMQRDGDLDSDDEISVAIDTFFDRRNGYLFRTGPAGPRWDALIENGGDERVEWDGIWYLKTTIDAQGWTVEMSLPFKTVSFNPNTDKWGLNVERVIRRKQETVRWATPRNNIEINNIGDAGDLLGMTGMRQGLGLTFKPFTAANFNFDNGDISVKPGFDLFYQITPSITAALTVNTDFAETEVDERRVNLTRFPLFFPEKRAFFLQDAGIFAFAGIEQSPLPFHSRRIGIVGGQQKDILAGLKVTGRTGPLSFGLLDVQMKDDPELGNKNLSVARGTMNVLEESTVGIIATHGDPGETEDNTLAGADFNYRNSSVFGDEVLLGSAWVMGTQSSNEQGEDVAFGGRIDYPNDLLAFELAGEQIGTNFNPALGFVDRTGVRRYFGSGRVRKRWDAWIRTMDIEVEAEAFTNMNNQLQTLEATLPQIEFESAANDELRFGYELEIDNPDEDFDIQDDIIIPAGDYTFGQGFASFESSAARPIAVGIRYANGTFYNGNRQDYELNLTWRPSAQFLLGGEFELNDVQLPEGDFIVRIFRLRGNVIFSPQLSWDNTLQYDNDSSLASLNSRVRWEVQPGNDVYVVLNQGWLQEDGRYESTSSELTLKVGMTFRY